MNTRPRNFRNPWPRLSMAALLTVWAGANLWSCVFRRAEILSPDYASRTVGIMLSILFTLLPLVIAIYLFWTVVVGADDTATTGKRKSARARS